MSHNRRRATGACLCPPCPSGLAALALVLALTLAGAGCRAVPRLDPMTGDPFYESFFEKASLIMTDDEVEIYRSLPDRESKAAFIEDFWTSRDIDPTTEENEGRAEFERRVAFANAWFSDWRTFRGRARNDGREADRGWDTDPGRVFIILGPPDYLADANGMMEPFDPTRLYQQEDPVPQQEVSPSASMTWVYERVEAGRPRLFVYFYRSGTMGRWRTGVFSTREGREAMEKAKLNYLALDVRDGVKTPLRCGVKYGGDGVTLKVGTSCLSYAEEGDKLIASLKVKVVVYRDGRRQDVVERTQDFAFSEGELLRTKNLEFVVPWRPAERGRYLFDILVTDMKSLRFATFRTYLRKKI